MGNRVSLASDFTVSAFIQGYWRLAEWGYSATDLLRFVSQHLEAGVSTVDHADIYGDYRCETLFGEALKRQPALRQQLEIVSKCDIKLQSSQYPEHKINHYDTSHEHIVLSVNNSLSRLNTDYLDVLLIHRPDILMNADQLADTFAQLKQAGKVRYFGVSNFTPMQFDLLQSRLSDPLVTNQIECNPINMQVSEDGTLEHLQLHRIKPMIWSCLAGGNIFQADTAQAQRLRHTLSAIGKEINASMDQVIYAWLLKLAVGALPVMGSSNIERLHSALAASAINLSREQWYQIWVASKGHNVP
jgi:predicted oxidoreductase